MRSRKIIFIVEVGRIGDLSIKNYFLYFSNCSPEASLNNSVTKSEKYRLFINKNKLNVSQLVPSISVVKLLFFKRASISSPDLYKRFQQTLARDTETWKIGR